MVLMLGALAGWYFYLHSQESNAAAVNTARGLGTAAPTFEGAAGSTQANQAIATQAFGTNSYSPPGTSTSQLWEADKAAVAGMGFVTTETDEHLYYVERANGYVFAAHPSDHTVARLTDTLMPKIYAALFADDGSVIERSIDSAGNVTTFLGAVTTSGSASSSASTNVARALAAQASTTAGAPGRLSGSYLGPGIQAIAIDPATRALFYLVADPHGGVDGITMQWDGSKKKQLFTSTVGSWQPSMLRDGTMSILESPADGIPGYAYSVSAAGALTPLVRDVAGLTLLSKTSSALLLYGQSSGAGLSLFGLATSTPELLPLVTVADKCVWLPGPSEVAYCAVPATAPGANFLDTWYRGEVNTSDDWWEVDLSNDTAKRIYSPSADNVSLDVENPIIDASGNYIAFENATDQSLWVLHVAQ